MGQQVEWVKMGGRRDSLTTFTRAEGVKGRARLANVEQASLPTVLTAAKKLNARGWLEREGAAGGGVHLPPGREPFTALCGKSEHCGHAAQAWNSYAICRAGIGLLLRTAIFRIMARAGLIDAGLQLLVDSAVVTDTLGTHRLAFAATVSAASATTTPRRTL